MNTVSTVTLLTALLLAPGMTRHAANAPAGKPHVRLTITDAQGQSRYRTRAWSTLKIGMLKLPPGRAKLTLEPLAMPGGQVMDLKHAKLTRYQP